MGEVAAVEGEVGSNSREEGEACGGCEEGGGGGGLVESDRLDKKSLLPLSFTKPYIRSHCVELEEILTFIILINE